MIVHGLGKKPYINGYLKGVGAQSLLGFD